MGVSLMATLFVGGLSVTLLSAFDGTNRILTAQSAGPTELSAEEQATIAVFERATRSVVFIANTAMLRDPWSFNQF